MAEQINAGSEYNAVSSGYCDDNTMMLKDYMDKRACVTLLSSEGDGRTLSLDMFKSFFEKTKKDTSACFRDRKIWQCGKEYTDEQGKYPVIFLSLKDVKLPTWKSCLRKLENLISNEFRRHKAEILGSTNIDERDKKLFLSVSNREADEVDFMDSLGLLSELLDECYNKGLKEEDRKLPYIMIDEYDTVLQHACTKGYYDDAVEFMSSFLSAGLKDNRHMSYGILTGTNGSAQNGLCSFASGLNNMTVLDLMEEGSSSCPR